MALQHSYAQPFMRINFVSYYSTTCFLQMFHTLVQTHSHNSPYRFPNAALYYYALLTVTLLMKQAVTKSQFSILDWDAI